MWKTNEESQIPGFADDFVYSKRAMGQSGNTVEAILIVLKYNHDRLGKYTDTHP